MQRTLPQFLVITVCFVGGVIASFCAGQDLAPFMPRQHDNTVMGWQDGFPAIVEDAPWRRFVRTGLYSFVLDTDRIRIPRLGPADEPRGDGAELSLNVVVDGKTYTCNQGVEWSRFAGPRVIESGRFLQRADVNGLVFEAKDGSTLHAESRFESAAWPDQLALTLAIRAGESPFTSGDKCWGRVNGGFGLSSRTKFTSTPQECHATSAFTLCLWAFLSPDFQVGPHAPWLVCKNGNETVDGNYGIMLSREGVPTVRLNIGGGNENAVAYKSSPRHALRVNQWNHLALSYDNQTLRLVVNGNSAVEEAIGKHRQAPRGGLAIGGREDGASSYSIRGAVDEVFVFDRALDIREMRMLENVPEQDHDGRLKPLQKWTFRDDVAMRSSRPREKWENAVVEVSVFDQTDAVTSRSAQPKGHDADQWLTATVTIDPVNRKPVSVSDSLVVTADNVLPDGSINGKPRPASVEPSLGCYKINLDNLVPLPPPNRQGPSNDSMERVRINLSNPTDRAQIARLMFEKTGGGFKQRLGQPITGISAILRDTDGNPTGIPIQLSKNWHDHPEAGVYSGTWFHGISQVRVPAGQSIELELSIIYGHWGGVAAASHAQLSLIGWGTNTLWDQSAMGAWGESICYNPEQALGECTVTDVRPVMVTPMSGGKQWNWTNNVGGADFFRFFDTAGKRGFHAAMEVDRRRQGPCLTEIQYSGKIGDTGIRHRITSSLSRTDDLVRATYRIRMDVDAPVEFERFVIFQTGADTYTYTQDRKLAVGQATGLISEWNAHWGGNVNRGDAIQCSDTDAGGNYWASLHATEATSGKRGAWANRGFVIRDWQAVLGGQSAAAWITEHGTDIRTRAVSTLDLIPPPKLRKLLPGDYVEATVEFVVVPQFATDYYGPNESLRAALNEHADTWKMIQREARLGALKADTRIGKLSSLYPGVTIETDNDAAKFDLEGGLGYVPITFTGLTSHRDYTVTVDGTRLDQAVHGNDFWQTDYDTKSRRWSQTFNLPAHEGKRMTIKFGRKPL